MVSPDQIDVAEDRGSQEYPASGGQGIDLGRLPCSGHGNLHMVSSHPVYVWAPCVRLMTSYWMRGI